HRAGADRADVHRLVADGTQHALVPVVDLARAADPDRELAGSCAGGAAAYRRIEHGHAKRGEVLVHGADALRRERAELEPGAARSYRLAKLRRDGLDFLRSRQRGEHELAALRGLGRALLQRAEPFDGPYVVRLQ